MRNSKTGLIARLVILALIIALASPLAACGRKNAPERPEDSEYPRNYPSQ
jgi:hypothetical protein